MFRRQWDGVVKTWKLGIHQIAGLLGSTSHQEPPPSAGFYSRAVLLKLGDRPMCNNWPDFLPHKYRLKYVVMMIVLG